MEYLIGIIAALGGWLFWERSRRQTAEGALDNLETKTEVATNQGKQNANNADLATEVAARVDMQATLERELGRKLSDEELARFLNKR